MRCTVSYDNGSLTLSWQEAENTETYYVYRYHPDADMLSSPKVVTGKTSCTYRNGVASETSFLVTTEKLTSRKNYDGAGAVMIKIPNI